ncbi:MAG: methyltransferase domain-containing protein [Planctomycetaceae bacterium]
MSVASLMPVAATLPPPTLLSKREVLEGYRQVSALYPNIPPLSLWRAWEVAAYARYQLPSPALDVGCGDGQFFRLIWPEHQDVVGIDCSDEAVTAARASGVYKDVHQATADKIPFCDGRFAGAFANCSLEHMDNIDDVLRCVADSLQPGGEFIFSVITDKYREWAQSLLVTAHGAGTPRGKAALADFTAYHHLVSPLSIETWGAGLQRAGFDIVEYIPILPEPSGSLFLMLDLIWHSRTEHGELGDDVGRYLGGLSNFADTFGRVVERVLEMSHTQGTSCGVVFHARKQGRVHSVAAKSDEHCWCGETALLPFSPEYRSCPRCQTLVSIARLSNEELVVKDDDSSFYGRNYWLDHQTEDYSQPNILQRARNDLTERCLHWLKTLIKYRPPPARILELGAAHGGFVSLMRTAGYDATGLELSPWVREFAQQTFNVPMLLGPVEDQDLPPASFDVIALMDVLEHLPDPEATMRRCFELLKPDGLLLIQTPCYRLDPYQELVDGNHRFLIQLKASEHLNLFTEKSVQILMERLGAWEVRFEPAQFDYDMFLVASRVVLNPLTPDQCDQAWEASGGARTVRALLELHQRANELQQACDERLQVIQSLDAEVKRLSAGKASE